MKEGDLMASRIDQDQVQHVASLAKLDLTNNQIEYFTKQLDEIIGLFEILDEVNTNNIAPTFTVSDQFNIMREDVAINWDQQDSLLANAPESENGYIKVPAILNESEDK